MLAAVLLLVALRLDQPDVSGGVRAFTFGMSAMAGLLVLADFAFRLLRCRGQARRRLLYPLPAVVAVAGSLVVADRILFGASAPDSPATLLWGAATMLAAGAGVGVWKLVEARRTARPRDRAHGG